MNKNVRLIGIRPTPRWGLGELIQHSLDPIAGVEGLVRRPSTRTPPTPRPSAFIFGPSGLVNTTGTYCKILCTPPSEAFCMCMRIQNSTIRTSRRLRKRVLVLE